MRSPKKKKTKLGEGSSTQLDESEAADLQDSVLISSQLKERRGREKRTVFDHFIDDIFNES